MSTEKEKILSGFGEAFRDAPFWAWVTGVHLGRESVTSPLTIRVMIDPSAPEGQLEDAPQMFDAYPVEFFTRSNVELY